MSGGSKGDQTSQTVTTPYAGIAPGMTQAAVGAQNIAALPYQQYGGQRISALAPEQQQGLLMTANRATAGSPVLNQAQGELQKDSRRRVSRVFARNESVPGPTGGVNQFAGENPFLERTHPIHARGRVTRLCYRNCSANRCGGGSGRGVRIERAQPTAIHAGRRAREAVRGNLRRHADAGLRDAAAASRGGAG